MGESTVPCLSRVQLEDMGVRIDSFPALKMAPPEACVAFDDIIPGPPAISTLQTRP